MAEPLDDIRALTTLLEAAGADSPQERAALADLVPRVRRRLERERRPGNLRDQLLKEDPRLGSRVAHLDQVLRSILVDLQALEEACRGAPAALEQVRRRVSERLRTFERSEVHLLQDTYLLDIGGGTD